MFRVLIGIFLFLVVIGIGVFAVQKRVVGLHYPVAVENGPMHDPQRISMRTGNVLTLSDGSLLTLDAKSKELDFMKAMLSAGDEIEIEASDDESVIVSARVKGWICGTPWARPIVIPIIPDRVYRNQVRQICSGRFTKRELGGGPTLTPPAAPPPAPPPAR